MGKETSIEWADSSGNLQMGCDGCELWNARRRICYAGIKVDHEVHGRKGWPMRFDRPELFLDRLPDFLRWPDLAGDARPEKPWLNGLPRLIFLNDMGDTFTNSLPLDWMAPLLPAMGASPHRFLLLTKRPSRMAEFSARHPFPANFWLGTSVTTAATARRVEQLREVQGGELKFVSFEPMWEVPPASAFEGIAWAIFGGESGMSATAQNMGFLLTGMRLARDAGAAPFVKQLGSNPFFEGVVTGQPERVPFKTRDSHGGDWREWPAPFCVRKMPKIHLNPTHQQTTLL